MRLVATNKDYYDGCQRADLERTPVYVRKPRAFQVSSEDRRGIADLAPVGPQVLGSRRPDGALFPACLVVCGRAWTFWYASHALVTGFAPTSGWAASSSLADKTWAFWTLDAYLDAHREDRWVLDRWKEPADIGAYPNNRGKAELWLGRMFEVPADLHRRLGTPVFLVRQFHLGKAGWGLAVELDPPLRLLGFASVMDPATLWQTIDTYLGNEMAVQRDPEPLSDALRRDAHGFDDRSFKQAAPGEKKARRVARRKGGRT